MEENDDRQYADRELGPRSHRILGITLDRLIACCRANPAHFRAFDRPPGA